MPAHFTLTLDKRKTCQVILYTFSPYNNSHWYNPVSSISILPRYTWDFFTLSKGINNMSLVCQGIFLYFYSIAPPSETTLLKKKICVCMCALLLLPFPVHKSYHVFKTKGKTEEKTMSFSISITFLCSHAFHTATCALVCNNNNMQLIIHLFSAEKYLCVQLV